MESLYYDLSAPDAMRRNSLKGKYSNSEINEFLKGQEAYTRHRPARYNFKRRKTFSKSPNELLQADLADVSNISKHNDNYKFLLTIICVFSKMGYCVPLKSKNASEVADAFEQEIFVKNNIRPVFLQTDNGIIARIVVFNNKSLKFVRVLREFLL